MYSSVWGSKSEEGWPTTRLCSQTPNHMYSIMSLVRRKIPDTERQDLIIEVLQLEKVELHLVYYKRNNLQLEWLINY